MMRHRTMRNKASLGWLHHFDLWPLLSKWSRSESILGYESAILEFWTFNLWTFHKQNSYRNLISMRKTWNLFTFAFVKLSLLRSSWLICYFSVTRYMNSYLFICFQKTPKTGINRRENVVSGNDLDLRNLEQVFVPKRDRRTIGYNYIAIRALICSFLCLLRSLSLNYNLKLMKTDKFGWKTEQASFSLWLIYRCSLTSACKFFREFDFLLSPISYFTLD